MRYRQRINGEGFSLRSGERHRIACCSCGLVHDMVVVSSNRKPVGLAFAVNKRATAARRRLRGR